ncbi:hypothetical protein BDK51DRAFT_34158 [Blyttiomyces helicus]|uniref:Uncharacterized protein n=1 Tax=Blyttiomyces helicus TaxID=388810 RepID=A0A4P9WC30_9FUNG|nr:hypothetical protein BDK51DRAFT_34158 [Blyttiomyces helicus]|eukprot:RKO90201.1 hypothetical protein BDK51DRAFT_34158 [Blyttiomyces helicus]
MAVLLGRIGKIMLRSTGSEKDRVEKYAKRPDSLLMRAHRDSLVLFLTQLFEQALKVAVSWVKKGTFKFAPPIDLLKTRIKSAYGDMIKRAFSKYGIAQGNLSSVTSNTRFIDIICDDYKGVENVPTKAAIRKSIAKLISEIRAVTSTGMSREEVLLLAQYACGFEVAEYRPAPGFEEPEKVLFKIQSQAQPYNIAIGYQMEGRRKPSIVGSVTLAKHVKVDTWKSAMLFDTKGLSSFPEVEAEKAMLLDSFCLDYRTETSEEDANDLYKFLKMQKVRRTAVEQQVPKEEAYIAEDGYDEEGEYNEYMEQDGQEEGPEEPEEDESNFLTQLVAGIWAGVWRGWIRKLVPSPTLLAGTGPGWMAPTWWEESGVQQKLWLDWTTVDAANLVWAAMETIVEKSSSNGLFKDAVFEGVIEHDGTLNLQSARMPCIACDPKGEGKIKKIAGPKVMYCSTHKGKLADSSVTFQTYMQTRGLTLGSPEIKHKQVTANMYESKPSTKASTFIRDRTLHLVQCKSRELAPSFRSLDDDVWFLIVWDKTPIPDIVPDGTSGTPKILRGAGILGLAIVKDDEIVSFRRNLSEEEKEAIRVLGSAWRIPTAYEDSTVKLFNTGKFSKPFGFGKLRDDLFETHLAPSMYEDA